MAKNSVRAPSNSVVRVRRPSHRPQATVLFVAPRSPSRPASSKVSPQGAPATSKDMNHAKGTQPTVHTSAPPGAPQALFTGLEFLRKFGSHASALNPRLVHSTLQLMGKIRAHRQHHKNLDQVACPGCQGAQALRMYRRVAASRGIPLIFSDSSVAALIEDCTSEPPV